MKIFIPENFWQKSLKGWHITDCSVRDSSIIYLVARKNIPHEKASLMWDHDILTRFLAIYLDDPRTPYGGQDLTGFNRPRCGVSRKPLSQGLIVARNNDGDVWTLRDRKSVV